MTPAPSPETPVSQEDREKIVARLRDFSPDPDASPTSRRPDAMADVICKAADIIQADGKRLDELRSVFDYGLEAAHELAATCERDRQSLSRQVERLLNALRGMNAAAHHAPGCGVYASSKWPKCDCGLEEAQANSLEACALTDKGTETPEIGKPVADKIDLAVEPGIERPLSAETRARLREIDQSLSQASAPTRIRATGEIMNAAEQEIWERSEDRDGWPVLMYREDLEAALNAALAVSGKDGEKTP